MKETILEIFGKLEELAGNYSADYVTTAFYLASNFLREDVENMSEEEIKRFNKLLYSADEIFDENLRREK